MNNLTLNKNLARLDLLIYILDRSEEIALEINNSAKSIWDYPVDLIQLKEELLVIRQQSNGDRQINIRNYRVRINSLIAELERLKISSLQSSNRLNKIVALQEKVEVLQVRQTITSSPNYHCELPIATDSAIEPIKQYSLREKILIFKLKYPENFWAGIIAIFLFLLFSWRATATTTNNLPLSDSSGNLIQLH